MTYDYICRAPSGEKMAGQLSAESLATAEKMLFSQGLFIVSLEPKKEQVRWVSRTWFRRVTLKDLTMFTRQFGRLIHAGLSVTSAIETLRDQTAYKPLASILDDVSGQLRAGEPLNACLRNHPRVFSSMYVNMVRAGELGGALEEVLQRLSSYLENEQGNRARVVNALIYPAAMLSVGIVTMFLLMSFVLPRFVAVFEQMGQDLPLITRLLIGLSLFMQHNWWLVLAATVALLFLWRSWVRTPSGRAVKDRLSLRAPILGRVIVKSETAKFTRTLGTLLDSGVTMLPAIETAADTMGNTSFKRAMAVACLHVREGEPLSSQLRESSLFLPMVSNVVAVAEKSGTLARSLQEIADDYDAEVGRDTRIMLTLLEPILIVLVGGLVGSIVVAMLLPIFSLEGML